VRGRKAFVGLLVAIVTLLVAAGCSYLPWVQEEDSNPDPTTQPELENTSWVLEASGPESSLKPAIAGHKPTIDFGEGDLSGSAGCNSYFGLYTYDTNGSLEISGLGNTEMACPEPGVMEQEQVFLGMLRAAESYRVVSGKLRIRGGGNLLVLARSEGAPPPSETPPEEDPDTPVQTQPSLEDTYWELESYGAPGSLIVAVPGKESTITFTSDEISGFAGCNTYLGSYESDTDGSLEASDIARTAMYCTNEDVRNQEDGFMDALQAAEKYEVAGQKLRISGGGMLLVLREAEEEPEPVEQPELKTTSWKLKAYGTTVTMKTAISGKEPTLEFDATDLGGTTGCNSYFGEYTSDTDGSLEVGSLGSTRMLCTGPGIMQQEHDYLEALSNAEEYEVVSGELLISGNGHLLVFEED